MTGSTPPASSGDRIELDPARRNPLTRVPLERGVLRMLLDRSKESADRGEPSQDYVVVERAPRVLCFAVTDGVGSSFLGDLAARILASWTAGWLAALGELPKENELASRLGKALGDMAVRADEFIADYPLPDDVQPFMREPLERQRAYGSEAMLVCGRIEWPHGGPARVGVAWLGDAHLRVLLANATTEDFSGRTSERWSTKRGPRGAVKARVWTDDEVERVIACSDGLLAELDATVALGDAQLDERLQAAAIAGLSDDIALVDVAVVAGAMPSPDSSRSLPPQIPRNDATPPETGRAIPSPALGAPSAIMYGRDASVSWSAVDAAQQYEVQLSENVGFREPIIYHAAAPALTLPPGSERMRVRVRALAGDGAGAWSDVLEPRNRGVPTDTQPEARLRYDERYRELEVAWDDVPGADSYLVEVDDGNRYGPLRRRITNTRRFRLRVSAWKSYRLCITAEPRHLEWERTLEFRAPER